MSPSTPIAARLTLRIARTFGAKANLVVHPRQSLARAGLDPTLRLDRAFTTLCTRIRGQGYRGVVEPHARVTIGPGPLSAVPAFDPSLGEDPYFHPAYASVVPLRLAAERGHRLLAARTAVGLHHHGAPARAAHKQVAARPAKVARRRAQQRAERGRSAAQVIKALAEHC
jgi:hypothetical protein